mmetsp:Transcript_25583/g.21925  ORF Transcript_25583/g.21925 Transcript_25583/m.21925 type:complete len:127 (+) Transcript_25583:72-452(+)
MRVIYRGPCRRNVVLYQSGQSHGNAALIHLIFFRFHCVKRPGIEIGDYIRRLAKHFGCSDEVFVLCLIYIDRAIKRDDTFAVSALNVHRLVLTALTIAAKFHDDIYYSNAFYARVGGVSVSELNPN